MMEESNRNPYYHLDRILNLAYSQSAEGKGKKRHAKDNEPFEDQQIMEIARRQGNLSGQGFQVHKKTYEAEGMFNRGEYDKAKHELLGAIVYAAGMILLTEEMSEKFVDCIDKTTP
jgi:hypothetical protein